MPPNVRPNTTIEELAGLLARGVIRHLKQSAQERASADDHGPPETSESGRDSLELPRTTVLSVFTGLRTRDSERTRT